MRARRTPPPIFGFIVAVCLAAACVLPAYEVRSTSGTGGHGATSSSSGGGLSTSSSGGGGASSSTGGAGGGTLLSQGSACTAGDVCSSSFCVDGFCCDTACTGTCTACSGALTGAMDGTCSPVTGGTDPKTQCAGEVCCSGACTNLPTDADNCGTCGNACSVAAPSTVVCASGRCLATLVSGLEEPWGIAVDAANVYFTDEEAQTVSKVPIGGGTVVKLASTQQGPMGVAVNATTVFWVNGGGMGRVMKCAVAGCNGAPTQLASTQPEAWGIAASATKVFWTTNGPCPEGNAWECASGTCTSPLELDSNCNGPNGQGPQGIAVDSTNVYWVATQMGGVFKCAIGGCNGSPTQLALGQEPWAVAVASATVYWTNRSGGTVMKCPATGGCGLMGTQLASGQSNPNGIAVDSTNVYWVNNNGGANGVMSVPVTGGTATTLAAAQKPFNIAVDATSLYWTDQGVVMKLTPK